MTLRCLASVSAGVFLVSPLTHSVYYFGCEQLKGKGSELDIAAALFLDFLLVYQLTHKNTQALTGKHKPDRHLDVLSSINLAPVECWNCERGISHLTAHAL